MERKMAITGGRIIYPDRIGPCETVISEAGRITALLPADESFPEDSQILDATNLFIAPGFIDIHTHGCAGADFMDGTPEALERISMTKAAEGVTSFLATTITAQGEAIRKALATLQEYPTPPGAKPLGIHLEGPYIDPARAGAQPLSAIRLPSATEFEDLFASGLIRVISLAPELPGASELIRAGRERGIVLSIGHSSATYEQALAAADAGVTSATHLFNALPPLHHRQPGAVGAVLDDQRFYAEIIADGVHLHPAIIRLVARLKGPERLILITDAIRAAGLPDGDYDLGGESVIVQDGVARTVSGSLAGSTLSLDQALRNTLTFTDLSLPEVIRMISLTPATLLGIEDQTGSIAVGKDSDLTLLDSSLSVMKTISLGEVIYQRKDKR